METPLEPLNALLIESDPASRDLIRVGLESFGDIVVDCVPDRWGAELVGERQYDIVIVDLEMPDGSSGFEVIDRIRELDDRPKIIALKPGRTSRHLSREKNQHDVFALLTLPLDIGGFFKTVARARSRIREAQNSER